MVDMYVIIRREQDVLVTVLEVAGSPMEITQPLEHRFDVTLTLQNVTVIGGLDEKGGLGSPSVD